MEIVILLMKEIVNVRQLARQFNLPLPIDEDFQVKRIETAYRNFPDTPMLPFRHKLYAVSLYEQLDIELKVGFWKVNPNPPFLLFKSPYQVMAWTIHPSSLRGWSVMFTEKFLLRHPTLSHIIEDFPFLQLDKSVPLEIADDGRIWLETTYQKIFEEYQSDHSDRYELIASYLQTLLLQVNRLYARKAAAEPRLAEAAHHNDHQLITRFRDLITREIAGSEETDLRSVTHYAKELAIHPNHLNVVAKRTTGHNALQIIHEQLINTSKTRLLQTTLSVKELAYQLAFKEPTHFVSFFKKHTKLTPLQFREQEKGTAF
jgi:AraC family transcriptional regulator, transcriptional activator of pobA